EFGPEQLPYAFVLVALTAGAFIFIYTRFEKKARLNLLIAGTTIASITTMFVFWGAFHINLNYGWLYYAFYIWVAIFGVISATQFWLLANYVFNAREAKRLFGFIGAGGISGAIFGGYLTNFLASWIGTVNLLVISMAFMLICLGLLRIIWRASARKNYMDRLEHQKRFSGSDDSQSPIRAVLNSPHLTYISVIILVSVIVANLVDYQFNSIASEYIADEDRLTAFFGFWFSNLSIASLIIQLFVTSRALSIMGVTPSLLFLPLGILIGAAAMLFNPALWSAILIKVSDGAFKQSINKASVELLFMPVPAQVKNRAKAFIDVFIDNLATGAGGLLLILMTILLGFTVSRISILVIALTVIWIYMIFKVRREYLHLFARAITRRNIDLESQTLNLQDSSIFESVIRALESNNNRQVLYILNLLGDVKDERLGPYYKKLIDHPSDDVRLAVLKLICEHGGVEITEQAKKMTVTPNQEIQIESMRYLYLKSGNEPDSLTGYLNHDKYHVQAAAMMTIAEEYKRNKQFRKKFDIVELFESRLDVYRHSSFDIKTRELMRATGAKFIGTAGEKRLHPYLKRLLQDNSPVVVRAAIWAVGEARCTEYLPDLLTNLGKFKTRKAAREALANFGEDVIHRLAKTLADENTNREIRLAIPRTLSMIDSQESVNVLLGNLSLEDLQLRHLAVKSLNRLRNRFKSLKFDRKSIFNAISDEINYYYRVTIFLSYRDDASASKVEDSAGFFAPYGPEKAHLLLEKALKERLSFSLERVFRLLGLVYSSRDIFNAYNSINSDKKYLRANAVEFLDNLLDPGLRKYIIPTVEAATTRDLILLSEKLFGMKIPAPDESIKLILQCKDNWLKTCAIFLAAESKRDDTVIFIDKLKENPDPVVRETVDYALNRLNIHK
ncbi:MAG: hypothetical protein GF307_13470, partial [candidate division Zixibacteria bacterium]|nr:hypothetical protein [candidate division Zixibacteria bacterium]